MVLVEGVMVLLLEEMRSGVVGSLTQLKSVCASSARGYISKYKLTIRGGSKTSLSLSLFVRRAVMSALLVCPRSMLPLEGGYAFSVFFSRQEVSQRFGFSEGSFPERQFLRNVISQFPLKKTLPQRFQGLFLMRLSFFKKQSLKKHRTPATRGPLAFLAAAFTPLAWLT